MNLPIFFFVLIFTFLSLKQTFGEILNCIIVEYSGDFGCQSDDLFNRKDEINSVFFHGHESMDQSKIKFFEIPRRSITNYIPLNICENFQQLKSIIVKGGSVESINKKNFYLCTTVTDVLIQHTKISEILKNTFDDLINLERLSISNNEIKYLPEKLLSLNLKLTYFEARDNEIELIDLKFSENLSFIDLKENKCINQIMSDGTDDFGVEMSVEELNRKINEQCSDKSDEFFGENLISVTKGDESTCSVDILKFSHDISHYKMSYSYEPCDLSCRNVKNVSETKKEHFKPEYVGIIFFNFLMEF
jgi:hypothetical protein